jgi:1-acyl-sn-glycerol-3-phosphate acyltransferase
MKRLRRIVRLIRLAMHVFAGVLLTVLFAGVWHAAFYPRLVRWWLNKGGEIVGVKIKLVGKPAEQAVLMVANHISWLDIPLLGGVANPRFLSKQEVRQWPVIGWLAAKSGTLFITRGKAGAAVQAAATILDALRAGNSVLLFPEGTTTTGNDVRTFHARLFAPAFEANVPVQPVALRYPGQEGLTHPVVPYVDQQSLWDNLKALLAEPSVQAEIHFLPPITTTGTDRKALAAACEQQIRAVIAPARV